MTRKPLTLRTCTIVGAAGITGTSAGDAITALCVHAGWSDSGAGKVIAVLVGLWTLDKLHALVGEERSS